MTRAGVRREARPWLSWILLRLALPTVAACQLGSRAQATPAQIARWQRDSAQYVQDSAKWVRDSIVRDSISRVVNSDSLYRLYRKMLVASDPVPFMLLVDCEQGRLTWQFRTPAIDAISRMGDTVWHDKGERDAANRMWSKLHNMSIAQMAGLGVSPQKCGWRRELYQGEIYNGTDLDIVTLRPRAPKRP